MGNSNKECPCCGHKMRQQFIGLQHCKCGMSWLKNSGYFERTSDMKFCLQRQNIGKKVKQVPVIRYFSEEIAEKDYEKQIRQERTQFAIYSDNSEEFQHKIKIQKNNKNIKKFFMESLKNKGFNVHYIFTKKEIDKVKTGQFVLNDVPVEVVTYLEQHLGEWEKYLDEIQVPKKRKRKK